MTPRVPATRILRHVALAVLVAGVLAACKSSQPSGAVSVTTAPSPTPAPIVSIAVTPTLAATSTSTVGAHPPVTAHPTATPHPTLTVGPTATRRPTLGDLTIYLARGDYCGFYSDTGGGLWLNPRLVVAWTGPGPFPAANLGFSMTTNYGKHTAGGPVHSTTPFTWAIGGEPAIGNAWLGHTVKITVTIDPGNDVHETNESNNVTVITVPVPSPLPFSPTGSDGDYTIPCS